MNARAIAFLLFILPSLANAQGFAGLGTVADNFATPEIGRVLSFPADHAAHPEYRIEWWYLTSNLTGADGTDYGLQWTLFRAGLKPDVSEHWQGSQLWMGHAAITTPEGHFFTERLALGGTGQAGVEADPFAAWIDEWQMTATPDLSEMALNAAGLDFAYDLSLLATGPLVLHGQSGYSTKSAAGQASYYYSQPFYEVTGTLVLPSGEVGVSGSAWLDHEWSSQPLAGTQEGWDWFSLSFDDGSRLMGFQLRHTDGARFSSASWIAPDGATKSYPDGSFVAEPLSLSTVDGIELPTKWHVSLRDQAIDVTVAAVNDKAWMATSVPYWEGPVKITGSRKGSGYLEMTGYKKE